MEIVKIVRINDVCFRGQYAYAIEKMMNGEEITIDDFYNGKYEATNKVKRFISLLEMARIKYDMRRNENDSIRSTVLKKL